MRRVVSTAICLLLLVLAGCAAPDAGICRTPGADDGEPLLRFAAQVVFVPLEGGFYGLRSDSGEQYDPVNLPETFRQDGLRVRVEARPLPRSVGVHMWGRKIEIVTIERW